MKNEPRSETYWGIVRRRFFKNKVAVAALLIVAFLFFIALVADFLANDKPLIMSYQGRIYLPILKDYAVSLGFSQRQSEFQYVSYKDISASNFKSGDWAWFPPIRYSETEYNLKDAIQPP